jgi:hypothetical protein
VDFAGSGDGAAEEFDVHLFLGRVGCGSCGGWCCSAGWRRG